MILNRYIITVSLLALLAAGCAPSLKAPPQPKAPTRQQQPSRPDLGSFQDVLNDNTTTRPMTGGQQGLQEQTPESISKKVRFLLPSTAFINDRISVYEKKLATWRELQNTSSDLNYNQEDTEKIVNCYQGIRKVLDGYKNMHSMIEQLNSSTPPIINSVDILELQRTDIEFVEGACNRLMVTAEEKKAMEAAKLSDISQIEDMLKHYWEAKEYEEVTKTWSKIAESQVGKIDKKTKLMYGKSLMFQHTEDKAAEVFQQIVNQTVASGAQVDDLLSLRKTLADLYTASGNYPAAQQQYTEILKEYKDLGSIEKRSQNQLTLIGQNNGKSPVLAEYSRILQNYMGYIPKQDGYKFVWLADTYIASYPDSPVAGDVKAMRAEARKRADSWFDNVFAEVDTLSGESKFSEAIEMLRAIPDDIISPEQRLKIRDKKDALRLSDYDQKEKAKISKMQDLRHRWNEGLTLLDEGKFDEAVAVFKGFQDTDFAAKAQDKLEEISVIAAKAERRKAAQLFLRFTRTSDPELKKRLLYESRKLLMDILVKYPNIDFADKVEDNIKTIESKMNTLDPTFLPSIKAAEGQQGINNAGTSSRKYPDVSEDIKNATSLPVGGNEKVQETDIKQP